MPEIKIGEIFTIQGYGYIAGTPITGSSLLSESKRPHVIFEVTTI